MIAKSKIGMHGDDTLAWHNLTKDSCGTVQDMPVATHLHVQVLGELSGGALVMEGSNLEQPSDTDWSDLTDSFGNALVFMDTGRIRRSDVIPRWVRPRVNGGDENTKVMVVAAARKA